MPINLKALAISKLKKDMAFRTSFDGSPIPVSSFEDWCVAANRMLSIRIAGISTLRFAAKRMAEARACWKTPRQQESLNVISEMLIKAEQRCADRAAKRQEKRLLRGVLPGVTDRMIQSEKLKVTWQPGDPGRPPLGVDRIPKPPKAKRGELPPPPPLADLTDIWKRGIAELQQQKEKS